MQNAKLEKKLIAISYNNYFIVSIGEFLAVVLYAYLLWYATSNHYILTIWLVITLVFGHLLRGVFLLQYNRQKKQGAITNTTFWKNYFIIICVFSGISWAVAGLLFIYVDNIIYRMVIFVYLACLIGAAGPIMLTFRAAYLSLIIPMWAVILFLSLSIAPSLSFILFSMIVIYGFIVLFAIEKAHKLLIKAIELELESSKIMADLKHSELTFQKTIENAPVGTAIVSIDGKCIYANQRLQELTGYSFEELYDKDMLEINHPDDIPMTKIAMNQLFSGKLTVANMEKRYIRKDGSIVWAMVSTSMIRDKDGKPMHFISQMKDISERIKNDEKMRLLMEKKMATLNELQLLQHDESLLNQLNRSLQICVTAKEAYPRIKLIAQDLFPEVNGSLSVFNKSVDQLETVIKWGKEELVSETFFPKDCFAIREATVNIIDDPEKTISCGHYITPPQGGYIELPLIIQNELIGVMNLIAPKGKKLTKHQKDVATSFSNVVKLALANINLRASLSELSLHDALTNLYNRRYLNDMLSRELIRLEREKNTLCVAMLDLDNFKKFNDTYSHLAGDEVLKLIGTLLTNNFRSSDIAFRFGGEEFMVVLLNTKLNNAVTRLDELRENLKKTPIYYKNTQLPNITISIGVAEAPQHGNTIDEIIRNADKALYTAKEEGKDRVIAYKRP